MVEITRTPEENTQGQRRRVTAPWFATAAAIAVPLCVLPSALWRLGLVIEVLSTGVGPCGSELSYGEMVYVASLSIVTMALAWLTVGLVRPWGEVFPRWLPFIGGGKVPVGAVTGVAATGATVIALIIGYALLGIWGFRSVPEIPPGCTDPADAAIYYVPLIAWAPLLYFVTYHYYKRRTRTARTRGALDSSVSTKGMTPLIKQ